MRRLNAHQGAERPAGAWTTRWRRTQGQITRAFQASRTGRRRVVSLGLGQRRQLGQIELRLTVERDATSVTVCVADTGIGIASHELPHVFEPFLQVSSPLSQSGTGTGMGLGLAVVRSLVELHGGHATVTSAGLGKGSEFLFQLPAPRSFGPHAIRSDH